MLHPETHEVTVTNGPRPAGPADECFYCEAKVGETHLAECVCRKRTVVVKAMLTYAIEVPEEWSEEDILSHRNDGSWCGNNCLAEIRRALDHDGSCMCDSVEYEFVMEATRDDENRYRVEVER